MSAVLSILAMIVVRALLPDAFVERVRPWAAIIGGVFVFGAGSVLGWAFFGNDADCSGCDQTGDRIFAVAFGLMGWGVGLFLLYRGVQELRSRRRLSAPEDSPE